MPAFVKTPHDEELWSKAKARAKEEGRTEDWAYITGIFKHMKGGKVAVVVDRWLDRNASEMVTDQWMEKHAAEAWDELVRQDEECVCEHGASEHARKDPHPCTVCTSARCPKFRSSQSE